MLQLNLAASIAQNESESISENMKWSYRNRAAQGKFKAAKRKYFGLSRMMVLSILTKTAGS